VNNNSDAIKKKRPRSENASAKHRAANGEKSRTNGAATGSSSKSSRDGDSQDSEILQLISNSKSEEDVQIKPLLHTIPQLLLRLSTITKHGRSASYDHQVLQILDHLVDLLSMEESSEEEDDESDDEEEDDSNNASHYYEAETVLCKNSRRHSDATAETVLCKNSVPSMGKNSFANHNSHHHYQHDNNNTPKTRIDKASDHGRVARMVGMHHAVMTTLHHYPRQEGIQRTGLYLLTLLVMPKITTCPKQQSIMIAGVAHLGGMEAAVQAMRQFPKSHELQATAFMFLASLFASDDSNGNDDDDEDDDHTSLTMDDSTRSFQLQQSSHHSSYTHLSSYSHPPRPIVVVSEEEQERVRIIHQCRCRFVHHLNGVEWIVQAMEGFSTNPSVQSTGIALLYGITVPIGGASSTNHSSTASDSCRSRMIHAKVGPAIVKALHQHFYSKDSTVHRIGTKCIQYLTAVPTQEKKMSTSTSTSTMHPRLPRTRRRRSSGMG